MNHAWHLKNSLFKVAVAVTRNYWEKGRQKDTDPGLIWVLETTTASVHDSQVDLSKITENRGLWYYMGRLELPVCELKCSAPLYSLQKGCVLMITPVPVVTRFV